MLQQYERDGSVAALASTHSIEAQAFAPAEGFEPVALAPVSPIGLNGVLGRIDQNNVASTIRNKERLFTSGIGLSLLATRFPPARPTASGD